MMVIIITLLYPNVAHYIVKKERSVLVLLFTIFCLVNAQIYI